MTFLSLREEIQNWTLESDQKCFHAIKDLSDTIFETQTIIGSNIAATKYSIVQNQVQVGYNFNHFLKLSEFKFTENKIEERIKQQEMPSQEVKQDLRSKLDILKEAIAIGIRNLQIKQEEGEKDNISVISGSEYSYSMANAVFRDARLPPYYGTKEFLGSKFLNLFTEDDEHEILEARKSMAISIANLPSSSPHSNEIDFLPPPPPLDTVLSSPVNISNPPPPPHHALHHANTLPIPEVQKFNPSLEPPPRLSQVLNKNSYQPEFSRLDNNLPLPPPPAIDLLPPALSPSFQQSLASSFANNQSNDKPQVEARQPIKRALTFQQQLALRLNKGKDYKPQPIQPIVEQVVEASDIVENIRQISKSSEAAGNFEVRKSLSMNTNMNDLMGTGFKRQKQMFQEDDEEEQNNIFNTNKSKKAAQKANEEQEKKNEDLMKKTTFNEDNLFKKKTIMGSLVIKPKQALEKKGLFGEDDEEEEEIKLTKPVKKQVKEVKEVKEVKQVKEVKPSVETKPPQKEEKKKNTLFDDEDEEDVFKPKPKSKIVDNKNVPKPVIKKSNPLLLDNDSDEEKQQVIKKAEKEPIVIKKQEIKVIGMNSNPLSKSKVDAVVKIQAENEKKVEPKKEEVRVAQEIKVDKKQLAVQKPLLKIEERSFQQSNVSSVSKQSQGEGLTVRRQKQKSTKRANLFDDEEDESNEKKMPNLSANKETTSEIASKKPQQSNQIKIQSSVEVPSNQRPFEESIKKDLKKIPGLAMGMGMGMGMPMMLPQGMIITKPSEAKQQQKMALEKQEEERKKQQLRKIKQLEDSVKRQEEQTKIKYEERNKQLREAEQEKFEQDQRETERLQLIENNKRQRDIVEAQNLQKQAAERQRTHQLEQEKIKKQERIRLQQQQERTRLQQEQKRIRLQQEQEQIRLQQERAQIAERVRLQKHQQERAEIIKIQQEQERIERVRLQQEQQERQQQQRMRIQQQQFQKIERERMLKQKQAKEESARKQQANQFLPKLPPKTGPLGNNLGLPSLPSIINNPPEAKKVVKKGLFNVQEDEKPIIESKKVEKKVLAPKKKGLFDDDEEDIGFKSSPKKDPTTKPVMKKKNLFDDDEDVAFPPPKNKASQEVIQPKVEPKKKTLFADDDDDISPKKQPVKENIIREQPVVEPKKKLIFENEDQEPKPKTNIQPQKKKNLFDDEEEAKPAISVKTTKTVPIQPIQSVQNKKKNLFDDDDDDKPFVPTKKTQPISPVPQITAKTQKIVTQANKNLVENDDDFLPKKQVAVKKIEEPVSQPAKKKGLLDDSGEEDNKPAAKPIVKTDAPRPSVKNKKNLFADSDSEDEIDLKKKREAAKKLKGLG